jgi:alginate O-acetyltransferase complex protein AlgI
MVFSSITFLFFFLPAILFLYFCSGKFKNTLLLAASLFFYGWGEGIYLLVMLASITVNYICGRMMHWRKPQETPSPTVLMLAIVFNFSLLAFFKYANFFTDNANVLLTALHLPSINLNPVHLPIGISFFTFQAVSYIIDVYRGKVAPQNNFINLGLYIALFPQLIAGPIVRYHDIARALIKRRVGVDDFALGAQRFVFGLSKKVLLANSLGLVADKIFVLPFIELSSPLAWLGAICYTFQIYYDFSGYSDMAIGLGRMFGFRFLENFNYPYISKSIREFWRRWHISLSSWLRDYLYIPLGGNRCGPVRTCCNLLIVFLLCGLWHGANWTFICWGLYHGFFLVIERTRFGDLMEKIWLPVRYLMIFNIIIIGWVLFRSDTISNAISYLGVMFGASGASNEQLLSVIVDRKLLVELSMAALFSVPILPALCKLKDSLSQHITDNQLYVFMELAFEACRFAVLVGLTYFTVISLAAGVYNPFIYFRF